MSEMIIEIAAQADEAVPHNTDAPDQRERSHASCELSTHSFPVRLVTTNGDENGNDQSGINSTLVSENEERVENQADDPSPADFFEMQGPQEESIEEQRRRETYRRRTVKMLRRYMKYSIETGRLPSLLGRELFPAQVTPYTAVTFEDRVIFVHDMERCLDRLDEFSRDIIARHILQEHDQAETGRLLNCTERTVRTYVPMAIDLLTEILLEVELLTPIN